MKVYELTLKVFLLKNLKQENALEKIAELIDSTLISASEYLDFHTVNAYKYYTFNSLFNLEKDGVYKEGNIYSIKIRTVDENLALYLRQNIADTNTEHIKGLTAESKELKKGFLYKIYNITPTIVKTDYGYWKGFLSLEDYQRRLRNNLIKKYNNYYKTEINEDFELFTRIEFDNRKPISCSYKDVNILGDKLTFHIAENEMAQKLSYFSLGAGVGEMNARGYGFLNYKFI